MFVNYLNNLPFCLIGSIGSILIINSLAGKKIKKNLSYNAIIILIYTLLNCAIFTDSHNLFQIILSILVMTLCVKYIHDFSIISSLICSIFSIALLLFPKTIIYLIYMSIFGQMNNNTILIIINIITIIISYLISKNRYIKNIIKPLIKRFKDKTITGELSLIILIISIISFFNYQLFSNRYIDTCNICFLLFIFMLIVFSLIYIWNKNRYKELKESYDNLFEYACIYEEELEKDKLLRHEYKNQLAVIKGLSKNKKVINHIDQLLENSKDDGISIKGLSNIPKGGLRGLFYYKISAIRKKNVDFVIDISKSVKIPLSQLKIEDVKTLTYILGIVCDNAIEECIKNKESNISIEIYKLGKEIKFIISNTIIDKINIGKIGEKGYSTKGKKHGNGLYLVNKLLKSNKYISLHTKVINNYFVQEIKIKTS